MDDIVKVMVTVRTNLINSKVSEVVEFDREDWDEMDDREKDEVLLQCVFGLIDWNYEEIAE